MKTPLPVAASIAQRPGYGGHAWAFLQFALGFRQLGYEPVFVDRLTAEMTGGSDERTRAAVDWFRSAMELAGLERSCSLLLDDGTAVGLDREEVRERIAAAPFLLNVMGFLTEPDLLEAAAVRVFLDVDPGFTQLWRELGQADLLAGHDRFVSVAGNLGRQDCEIPTCGVEWTTLRPPVVLDRWRADDTDSRTFSAIGSLRGPYDPIEVDGRVLGLRVHELRRFAELPRRSGARFRFALDADPADSRDVELLRSNGWELLDPRAAAGSPASYADFVRSSGAEVGIAKNVYVATNSGWLSDRSACFLAAGRPALCQDTGFRETFPEQEGLVAFTTIEEAVDGARSIVGEWGRHSTAARRIAEDAFDARKVLGGLLGDLGVA